MRHLDGASVLAVVNGPDGYVSPRWYSDDSQVPTWNYVSLELEGRVRRMDQDGLVNFLNDLSNRQEATIAEGSPWTMDKLSDENLRGKLAAIVGFTMPIVRLEGKFKLGQNRPRVPATAEGGIHIGAVCCVRVGLLAVAEQCIYRLVQQYGGMVPCCIHRAP